MSEIHIIREAAKIAHEAEHAATIDYARAELHADLKSMSPGNYAELLRQIVAANKADIKSDPSLPDVFLATSKHSILPDTIVSRDPDQLQVAKRIFNPHSADYLDSGSHVLIAPGASARMNFPAQGFPTPSDRPNVTATPPAARKEVNPTASKQWYEPALAIARLVMSDPPVQRHIPTPLDNPLLKK